MNDSNPRAPDSAGSWDAYWKGTGNVGAYSDGGANHPAVLGFWTELLNTIKPNYPQARLLDIASGNGAMVERAIEILAENAAHITSVDISESAIENIKSRFEQVEALVADAKSIPLDDGSFDIVTSQFGAEYAGMAAITEAARLVAPGGQLALMMHHSSGVIHQECTTNLEAVSSFIESGFVSKARAMFEAGFEAVRGGSREPYDEAARSLAPAVQQTEAIMNELGQGVADDTIARLYSDVARIHGEIQHYDPTEVLGWLNNMSGELETYRVRMASMVDAALDDARFESACQLVSEQGCGVSQAGPLLAPDSEIPLAWIVLAGRPS